MSFMDLVELQKDLRRIPVVELETPTVVRSYIFYSSLPFFKCFIIELFSQRSQLLFVYVNAILSIYYPPFPYIFPIYLMFLFNLDFTFLLVCAFPISMKNKFC